MKKIEFQYRFASPVKDIFGKKFTKHLDQSIAKLFRFVGIAENV